MTISCAGTRVMFSPANVIVPVLAPRAAPERPLRPLLVVLKTRDRHFKSPPLPPTDPRRGGGFRGVRPGGGLAEQQRCGRGRRPRGDPPPPLVSVRQVRGELVE